MSTLFVLVANVDYDGDDAVGVYSTAALANEAMLAWNAIPSNPHAWGIYELELDKMPEPPAPPAPEPREPCRSACFFTSMGETVRVPCELQRGHSGEHVFPPLLVGER